MRTVLAVLLAAATTSALAAPLVETPTDQQATSALQQRRFNGDGEIMYPLATVRVGMCRQFGDLAGVVCVSKVRFTPNDPEIDAPMQFSKSGGEWTIPKRR